MTPRSQLGFGLVVSLPRHALTSATHEGWRYTGWALPPHALTCATHEGWRYFVVPEKVVVRRRGRIRAVGGESSPPR